MKANFMIEQVKQKPGKYAITHIEAQPGPRGFPQIVIGSSWYFMEVDSNGVCYQLKPTTGERDGVLRDEGFTGHEIVVDPMAIPPDIPLPPNFYSQ